MIGIEIDLLNLPQIYIATEPVRHKGMLSSYSQLGQIGGKTGICTYKRGRASKNLTFDP